MRLAPQARRTPPSGIREIAHRALDLQRQGRDIIRLEVGEASAGTPSWIIEAAFRDALAGHTRYTASVGQVELRDAIAANLAKANQIDAGPENIVITVGAVQGISLALTALCERGDEVLVPDPAWPNYEMMATMSGISPRRYRCDPAAGFLPDLDEVRAAISPRTRLILMNSPHNPSGAVYSPQLVRGFLEMAERHDLVLLSDDAYDEIYFGPPPLNPGSLVPVDSGRWIAAFSFSKTYGMTGWRVGYLVVPRAIADVLTHLQEATVSCVSSIAQRAALAALVGPQDFVATQRDRLRQRRDGVIAQLTTAKRTTYTPGGAFYLLVDVGHQDDYAFTHALLETHGVSVAPGSAFGDVARGYVRVCYAAGGDLLPEAISRLIALSH